MYVLMDTFNMFRMEMFERNKYARRDVKCNCGFH